MQKIITKIKHWLKNLKNINKNTALLIVAVVGIVIVGGLIYVNQNPGFSLNSIFGMSDQALAKKAIDYINNNGLSSQKVVLVGSATEESGLVKFKIQIGSNSFDSYVTKDGKLLLPQVFDMSKGKNAPSKADSTAKGSVPKATSADVKKTDNPMLEAYVVARCPFGLQMQRAMAQAVSKIPELAKYIKARYIGSVASSGTALVSMHGEAEAKENLRQICIREEQPEKYWNYIACQMKSSGTENSCATSTGVDAAKLSACVSDSSKGVAYAKKDFALDNQYGVQGSPTLILDGQEISESDFGGRSADGVKSMVCAAFNNKPSFCNTKLSTDEATTSFSSSYSSGNAAASANSGAGCQAAQ
jgi:hypothetical protein